MRTPEAHLMSFTSNAVGQLAGGGGALAGGLAGSAATMGLSMLPAVAQFIAGQVGQGRKAANGLTQGLQQDFTNQVLVPLAELRKTNPQAAAAQMEPAWAAFQQQANQYGSQNSNTAKVVQQMFSTPSFMSTVGSILGRDPQSAAPAQQQSAQTQQQNYAGNTQGQQQSGGSSLLSGLGQAAGGVLGGLGGQKQGQQYSSHFQFPTQGSNVAGQQSGAGSVFSGLGSVLGTVFGGGGNKAGTGGGGGTATGGTGGSSTVNVNNSDTTPWAQILPILAGMGAKATGDVLSANAMNKKNDTLTAQAALSNANAANSQQQRNYYASALMPSILQGLGNRNPNQIQQATQQMNTAKFPTS